MGQFVSRTGRERELVAQPAEGVRRAAQRRGEEAEQHEKNEQLYQTRHEPEARNVGGEAEREQKPPTGAAAAGPGAGARRETTETRGRWEPGGGRGPAAEPEAEREPTTGQPGRRR